MKLGALGKWWLKNLLFLFLSGAVLRTALEDRMLQEELTGYSEYARKVSYLLFPGVW